MTRPTFHLGVALDDAGAHPAAWRSRGADAGLFSAERLVQLARTAERGRLDFVALDDGFDPPPPGSAVLPARFDALLALARVAPATTTIGLLPTVTTTHTEPFHVSKNVATLDLVSGGRAGWRVAVSTSPEAARVVRPHRSASARRAVGRGGGRDRGRRSAVGQLGGRRRDPRPAHRPLHRSRQGPLHRFRGRVLQCARPIDHTPATPGAAARRDRRPRPRRDRGRSPPRRHRVHRTRRSGRGVDAPARHPASGCGSGTRP